MGYLDRAIFRLALLDISEDDNQTQPTDIPGYEIIAVITPDTLDGATNTITTIEIDPGNGTFYVPADAEGAVLKATPWFAAFTVDEYLSVPAGIAVANGGPGKLVGARARMPLGEAEAADRNFWLVLLALPGSAD